MPVRVADRDSERRIGGEASWVVGGPRGRLALTAVGVRVAGSSVAPAAVRAAAPLERESPGAMRQARGPLNV